MTNLPKILVVDDHPTNLQLMLNVLSKSYQVSLVTSGQEALNLAQTLKPDVILLDVMMPDMDGLEVLQRLRQSGWGKELAVILVTADDSHETELKGLELGADDFITKPVSLLTLQLCIKNLAQRNQSRYVLQQTIHRLEEAEAVAHLGYWVINLSNGQVEWSKQVYEMFGIAPEIPITFELFLSRVHPDDQAGLQQAWQDALDHRQLYEFEHRILVEGEERWMRQRADLSLQDTTEKVMGTVLDITDHKRLQLKLDQMAYYDALTGLPNRSLLMDRLNHAMAQADRSGRSLAVLFLDLDGFKEVNDQFGHEAGDYLLKTLAERLTAQLRKVDTLARLGGDEFIALLTDLPDQSHLQALLERILIEVADPYVFNSQRLEVTASIGITYYPQNTPMQSSQLIRQADQAMYQAKEAGKNQISEFKF